ncbi:MAG: acyl-CoA dehydrogenase family protein [Alphaproteobacteria bacterium]|nr:acyl-CoA dehydrogenase family protein [Alphaproteobacteria bacterium]
MAALTEEQTLLRDSARAWVKDKSPVSALRKLRDAGTPLGYDAARWKEMAEMGWPGIIVPEAHGGSEFGYLSLGLVLEEMGRTLAASPLVSSSLGAATALMLGGNAAQKEKYLAPIAAGELVGTLAIDEGPHHAPERIAMKAKKTDAGYTLSGAKTLVAEGMAAGLFVVAARTSGRAGSTDGVSLFLVPADARGVKRAALQTMDSRGHAQVTFKAVKLGADALLGGEGQGWQVLEPTLDRTRAGLAAEMLGMAAAAFEQTVEYLKVRTQFGQLLSTFQALQHRAAKMFTELELTRSAVEAALQAIDTGANDIRELASLAKVRASETLHLVSNEMVQMHGGIGMTDAHDAGLYLKRARVVEAAYGNAAYHKERFARLNGI